MKRLIDEMYKQAKKAMIALDNLNNHFKKSFYETFSGQECGRSLKKIKFVYTTEHVSWLNMAEIKINLLDHECLDRNIGNRNELEKQTLVW
jgi:hypothetical protein